MLIKSMWFYLAFNTAPPRNHLVQAVDTSHYFIVHRVFFVMDGLAGKAIPNIAADDTMTKTVKIQRYNRSNI